MGRPVIDRDGFFNELGVLIQYLMVAFGATILTIVVNCSEPNGSLPDIWEDPVRWAIRGFTFAITARVSLTAFRYFPATGLFERILVLLAGVSTGIFACASLICLLTVLRLLGQEVSMGYWY
jgi:hypothetical protein